MMSSRKTLLCRRSVVFLLVALACFDPFSGILVDPHDRHWEPTPCVIVRYSLGESFTKDRDMIAFEPSWTKTLHIEHVAEPNDAGIRKVTLSSLNLLIGDSISLKVKENQIQRRGIAARGADEENHNIFSSDPLIVFPRRNDVHVRQRNSKIMGNRLRNLRNARLGGVRVLHSRNEGIQVESA